jgi:hypothetical protein
MPATTPNPGLCYHYPLSPRKPQVIDTDICIYGGTPAGFAAAIQGARMGKRCVVLEFGRHVGGMTSSGLGATDIGNKAVIGGIAREFYKRLGKHYGTGEAWKFEPHVAESVFEAMLAEHNVPVLFEQRLSSIAMDGNRIVSLVTEDGSAIRARIFIDATYEGDLMARAGVSCAVGREGNALYGENFNGVYFDPQRHNFWNFEHNHRVNVDPYVVPGNPASALLPGISAGPPGRIGTGDHRVQAYNFRLCLTKQAELKRPFAKPAGYDPVRYELLRRYIAAGVFTVFGNSQEMPNGKTDTNNHGAVASDHIGANYRWPEAGYAERELIFQDHVAYTQGLFYFIANDPGLPRQVRDEAASYGLANDEFPETNHWPHQLYVREARRMVADCVMREQHCTGLITADDSVGMAAYTMDAHNAQRVVVDGSVYNEGNVEIFGYLPYPVSYRAIVPKRGECENLLVPVCLSASHIAFGSIRMEPVFLVLGQSAATAACLAIDAKCGLQDVDYPDLRRRLEKDGQILELLGKSRFAGHS